MRNDLFKDPYSFNFFQAVHILEKMGYSPGRNWRNYKVGNLKFMAENSVRFPSSDLAGADYDEGKNEVSLSMTFMGLYGVSSPLPSYFSDPVTIKKEEYRPLKLFLDIFGHPIYTLFYEAWKKYRPDKNFKQDGSSEITKFLGSLFGRKKISLINQEQIHEELQKLNFGRFSQMVRSADNLRSLISGYFDLPRVKIKQFTSRWIENPARFIMGSPTVKLGQGLHLGEKIQDHTGSFSIEIGPVAYDIYRKFIKKGPKEEKLYGLGDKIKSLVNDYIKDPLDFSIKVYLDTNSLAPVRLGSERAIPGGGFWLGEKSNEPVFLKY